jgi:soluble lytic murein transglycosylase
MAATPRSHRPAPRRPSSRPRRPASGRRLRITKRGKRTVGIAIAVTLGVVAGVTLGLRDEVEQGILEVTLPLRHDDIIRQQAGDKDVDAALIAAVIYAESRFKDQTSHAGARGLMQITPDTANDIERRSGGTTFSLEDLADPQINISYGTFYLRELLDRYSGNVAAALAAYNAGPGNADSWGGSELTVEDIPTDETRGYVADVLDKQTRYREKYANELGYRQR